MKNFLSIERDCLKIGLNGKTHVINVSREDSLKFFVENFWRLCYEPMNMDYAWNERHKLNNLFIYGDGSCVEIVILDSISLCSIERISVGDFKSNVSLFVQENDIENLFSTEIKNIMSIDEDDELIEKLISIIGIDYKRSEFIRKELKRILNEKRF